MSFENYMHQMLPKIEEELKSSLLQWIPEDFEGLRAMMSYHMGWEGTDSGSAAQGKRIRPLILLLATAAAGGDWHRSLPLAVSVEFVHNFSLLHDDIQDGSRTRRGRQTVWVLWGMPQAINVGDTMYTLAFLSMEKIKDIISPETALLSMRLLQEACIKLTQGQHLDIAYEDRQELSIDDYWPMIKGKTAALLSCCSELGALAAGVDQEHRMAFGEFGHFLGLAFQVVDDWLGIWGDSQVTGKPTGIDLISGKKTLPVLFALSNKKRFSHRWKAGPISADEVEQLADCLVEEGAKEFSEKMADNLTMKALQALKEAVIEENDAYKALNDLALKLVQRHN